MDGIPSKNVVRGEMIAHRKSISPSDKQKWDQAIHKALFRRSEWQEAKTVCIYVSLPSEVDTKDLFTRQKIVIVPEKRYDETRIDGVTLFIVPGVAFDREGYRLGRGSGYYDRLLAGVSATKIGLAYDLQIVPRLPHRSYDIPMDIVITESGIVIPAAEPGSSSRQEKDMDSGSPARQCFAQAIAGGSPE